MRWFSIALWGVSALLMVGATTGASVEHAALFRDYAVAADHPEASKAGAEILAAGGNAADAAAATMLALGVVNPASSGLGGGGFALYYSAKDDELTFLDFRERAPAAATPDMFANADGETPPGPAAAPSQLGGLAAGVPGEPAGIATLVDRFGSMSLSDVIAPALRLAEEGFVVSSALASMGASFEAQLDQDPVMSKWNLAPGAMLRRPSLAHVLRLFAMAGVKELYSGPLGREMAAVVKQRGGIMTFQDLRDYRVVTREPLNADLFGYRWVTAPPPSAGGFTMLQSLTILERVSGGTPVYGAPLLHTMAESWKGPFIDRERYFGDPAQIIQPLDRMMSPNRIEKRAALAAGENANPTEAYDLPLVWTSPPRASPDNSGTSHLCVVDREGNVAAVTTTVNLPFGARFTAAGIVMNDEMDDFARGVGEPNAFGLIGGAPNLPGPRKRPVSTMSPTIVFKDGKPVLCVGASGGSRIVTATQQVAMNVLLFGMDAGRAVDAPRIHHQGFPDKLRVETKAPLDEALQKSLRARGHAIESIRNIANVQAIHIVNRPERRLHAVSDPRKNGSPAGR
ncbi:MAG: gamma-glutamyltransferase [Myxococcales bacterium]|nr:gamma-glutamyltransferase [Myxococcales bacterium]MDH3483502.1 gamma-glutamyltransferase [Myxococcales bacterium]